MKKLFLLSATALLFAGCVEQEAPTQKSIRHMRLDHSGLECVVYNQNNSNGTSSGGITCNWEDYNLTK